MFHLPFSIPPSTVRINHADPIVLLGSCFADSIGKKIRENKFNVESNPFGTIYNPLSSFKILSTEIDPHQTVESQGIFYNWDAHGVISALNEQELIEKVEHKQSEFKESIKQAKWLIITFGSAYVYRRVDSGQLVANCHKLPSLEFHKELLGIEHILEEFERTNSYLKSINPEIKTILTISPVRHVKDGLIENNRSKARLIEAVHSIVDSFDQCNYFPAYEILMDELRDYRFYSEDKVHPSNEAINYIWQKFSETYFDQQTLDFIKKWSKLQSAIQHRPFHIDSPQHQQFLMNTITELRSMQDQVDVSTELSLLESQLLTE